MIERLINVADASSVVAVECERCHARLYPPALLDVHMLRHYKTDRVIAMYRKDFLRMRMDGKREPNKPKLRHHLY